MESNNISTTEDTAGQKKKRRRQPSVAVANATESSQDPEDQNPKPKRKSRIVKGKARSENEKATSALADTVLQDLVDLFEAVDVAYVFLCKMKVPCKLSSITSLVNNACQGRHGDAAAIEVSIRRIVTACHKKDSSVCHMGLELLPDHTKAATDVHLVFPTAPGAGKAQIAKRAKFTRKAMEDWLASSSQSKVGDIGDSSSVDLLPPPCPLPNTSMPSPLPPALSVWKEGSKGLKVAQPANDTNDSTQDNDTAQPAEQQEKEKSSEASVGTGGNKDESSTCSGFDAKAVVDYLESLPFYDGQIVSRETVPSRAGKYFAGDLFSTLAPSLQYALEASISGTEEASGEKKVKPKFSFYHHQGVAISALLEGKHVAISTSTSSGKSVVYTVPIFNTILSNDSGAVALLIFPTKALAQDQLRSLKALANSTQELQEKIRCACLDGDTPWDERSDVASSANVILTNPDMLHASVLPNHNAWKRLLGSVRFIVVDEAHMYRGVFGAHVSMVLRRLLRIMAMYSDATSPPQFILCSATMADPRGHFSTLLPLESCLGGNEMLTCVTEDTSPQGTRTFLMWNPPVGSLGNNPWRGEMGSWESEKGDAIERAPAKKRSRKGNKKDCGVQRVELAPMEQPITMEESVTQREYLQLVGAPKTQQPPPSLPVCVTPSPPNVKSGTNTNIPTTTVGNIHSETPSSKSLPAAAGLPDVIEFETGAKPKTTISTTNGVDAVQVSKGVSAQVSDTLEDIVADEEQKEEEKREGRRSTITESARLLASLVRHGVRTLAFSRTRKLTELVLQHCRRHLEADGVADQFLGSVRAYRGGYTKADRRAIEKELFNGQLLGVAATCALELGIDIGELDATIHLGFPQSSSSMWQQAGRVGRSGRDSLSIFVLFDSPLDQYFAREGKGLVNREPEVTVVDTGNPSVLSAHILCASEEEPLIIPSASNTTTPANSKNNVSADMDWRSQAGKLSLFGATELVEGVINSLKQGVTPRLVLQPGTKDRYVSLSGLMKKGSGGKGAISLRMVDPVSFTVKDMSRGGVAMDTIEYSRAFYELYVGAIYLHQSRQFLITQVNLGDYTAEARLTRVNYYTSARDRGAINVTKVMHQVMFASPELEKEEGSSGNTADCSSDKKHEEGDLEDGVMVAACTGSVDVTHSIFGFIKRWLSNGQPFEWCETKLPRLEYGTHGSWLDLCAALKEKVVNANRDVGGGVHSANHAILAVLPLFLSYDAGDLDCEHAYAGACSPRPSRIMIVDKRPGGIGIAAALHRIWRTVLPSALKLLTSCPCSNGCPSCCHSFRCPSHNEVMDKRAAVILLTGVVQAINDTPETEKCRVENGGGGASIVHSNIVSAESSSARVRSRWIRSQHEFLSGEVDL